jgi:hypothetical protein
VAPDRKQKVVAHLLDGSLLKGYLAPSSPVSSLTAFEKNPCSPPADISIMLHETGEQLPVKLDSLKALFFVKSFDGRKEYKEVKFFNSKPSADGLWVRVEFQDAEVGEGIVQNSLAYLVQPGFVLKPPDPMSNNELVYVLKQSLKNFQVLGVRNKF